MNRKDEGTVKHPKSSKGKYVVTYNQGSIGNSYLVDAKGDIKYFNTEDEAVSNARGRNCWSVAKITKPLGD